MKIISQKSFLTVVILCFLIVIAAIVCTIILPIVDFNDKNCCGSDNDGKTKCECTNGIVTLSVEFLSGK